MSKRVGSDGLSAGTLALTGPRARDPIPDLLLSALDAKGMVDHRQSRGTAGPGIDLPLIGDFKATYHDLDQGVTFTFIWLGATWTPAGQLALEPPFCPHMQVW